jgi:hypothetical protein
MAARVQMQKKTLVVSLKGLGTKILLRVAVMRSEKLVTEASNPEEDEHPPLTQLPSNG